MLSMLEQSLSSSISSSRTFSAKLAGSLLSLVEENFFFTLRGFLGDDDPDDDELPLSSLIPCISTSGFFEPEYAAAVFDMYDQAALARLPTLDEREACAGYFCVAGPPTPVFF